MNDTPTTTIDHAEAYDRLDRAVDHVSDGLSFVLASLACIDDPFAAFTRDQLHAVLSSLRGELGKGRTVEGRQRGGLPIGR